MSDTGSSREKVSKRLNESIAVKQAMLSDEHTVGAIAEIASALVESIRAGHKVLLCGNGGSAADAQHIAAELVGRFYTNRKPLPALSLAVNTSTITALSNDFSFDDVFTRQVHGLGQSGDTLIGLSTSGDSENVYRALATAREMDMTTVAFTGTSGGKLLAVSDHCLRIPSEDTARIQEAHITAAHIICELVESELT